MKKKFFGIFTFLFSFLMLFSCKKEKEGVLRIGLECNYDPFNWTEGVENDYTLPIANKQGKFADGYDINLAKRLSSELNVNVEIMQYEWASLIIELLNKNIDLIIAGMTDTPERRKSIDFTDEYYRSELVLVTKVDYAEANKDKVLNSDELETLLENKYVVSQMSTLTDVIIDLFAQEFGANHVDPSDSFASAANSVKSGTNFAMTAELPVATSIVNNNKELGIIHIDQNILSDYQGEFGVSIGLRKGEDELKNKINQVLKNYSKEDREKDMVGAVSRAAVDVDTNKSDLERIFGKKEYVNWLFEGLAGTIVLSIVGTFLGLFLGIFLALGKNVTISKQDSTLMKIVKVPIKGLCNLYSVIIRGTPMMVQALVFQFVCQLCSLNWNTVLTDVAIFNGWFIAGCIIITFNTAAYMSEIIQSGLNGIDRGQREGALSLGFSQNRSLLLVELPQAIKNSIPTIGNEWIVNIKDSSVLNVISVTELFFMAKTIAGATYIYLTTYLIIAAMYLCLTMIATLILKLVSMKLSGKKMTLSIKNFLFHFKKSPSKE